jgi:hypothetical protein
VSDIQELARILLRAQSAASPIKVYFYGTEHGQLRTGFVNVYDAQFCDLHLMSLPMDRAIQALLQLQITRLMSMPLPAAQAVRTPTSFALSQLLAALQGGAKEDDSAVEATSSETLATATIDQAPTVLTPSDASRLIEATRACCAAYLGAQVDKKIQDALAQHPPQLRPEAFLKLMQQQLATMLGPAGAKQQLAGVARQFALVL